MKSILSLSSLFLFLAVLTSVTWASAPQTKLAKDLIKIHAQLKSRYQRLQTEIRVLDQKQLNLDSKTKTSIEALQNEKARLESRYASRVSDKQWLTSSDQAHLDQTFETHLGTSLLQGPISLEHSRRYIAWAIQQVEHLAKQREEKTKKLQQLQYVASRLGVALEDSGASERKPASQSTPTVSR